MSPEHGPILRSPPLPARRDDGADRSDRSAPDAAALAARRRRQRAAPLSADEQHALAAVVPAGDDSLATQLVRELVRAFDRERSGAAADAAVLDPLAGQLRKGEAAELRELRDRGVYFSNHRTVEHVAPIAQPPAARAGIARGTIVGAVCGVERRSYRTDATIPIELVDADEIVDVVPLPSGEIDETTPVEVVDIYELADLPRDPWDAAAGPDRLDDIDAAWDASPDRDRADDIDAAGDVPPGRARADDIDAVRVALPGRDRVDETDAVVRVDLSDLDDCGDLLSAAGSGAICDGGDAMAAAALPHAVVAAWIDEVIRAPDTPRHHVGLRHGARDGDRATAIGVARSPAGEPTTEACQELAEWAACLHECRRPREADPVEAPRCGENLVEPESPAGSITGDAHDQLFRRLDDYLARAEATRTRQGGRTRQVRLAQRGRNRRRPPLWLLSLLVLVAILAGLDHVARADTSGAAARVVDPRATATDVAHVAHVADDAADIADAADVDATDAADVVDATDVADVADATDAADVADDPDAADGDEPDVADDVDGGADEDDDADRSADGETLPGVDESSDAAADLHELVADGDDADDIRGAAELSREPSAAYLAELDDDAAGVSTGSTHQRPSRFGRFDVAVSWRHADYQPITVPPHSSDELWLVATWRR